MSANELAILTVIVDTAPLSNSYGFGPAHLLRILKVPRNINFECT